MKLRTKIARWIIGTFAVMLAGMVLLGFVAMVHETFSAPWQYSMLIVGCAGALIGLLIWAFQNCEDK